MVQKSRSVFSYARPLQETETQHVVVLATKCGSIVRKSSAEESPLALQGLVTDSEYDTQMSLFLQELRDVGHQSAGLYYIATRIPLTIVVAAIVVITAYFGGVFLQIRFALLIVVLMSSTFFLASDALAAQSIQKLIKKMRERVKVIFGDTWSSKGIESTLYFGRPSRGLYCLRSLGNSYIHPTIFSMEFCLVFERTVTQNDEENTFNAISVPVAEAVALPTANSNVKSTISPDQGPGISSVAPTSDAFHTGHDTRESIMSYARNSSTQPQQGHASSEPTENISYFDQMMKDLEK